MSSSCSWGAWRFMRWGPIVVVANELERASLSALYAMRGYAFAGEEDYLIKGRKQPGKIIGHLKHWTQN